MPLEAAGITGAHAGQARAGAMSQTVTGTMDRPAAARSDRSCSILGMRVDETDYDSFLAQVLEWTQTPVSRYACVSTVHMAMVCHDDPTFQAIVNGADMVAADGMPVIWTGQTMGLKRLQRVFGPTITVKLCELAARHGIPIGFYGSTPEVIDKMSRNMKAAFPTLDLAYAHSPPFRPLTPQEDAAIVDDITRAGVRIRLVGLGCPKQERWMADHRDRLSATMFGVGWGFEVAAGISKPAPSWVQKIGMEWFWRLVENPRKLWKRQARDYPRFVVFILLQLIGLKRYPLTPRVHRG
jgi:N-acetylglucosaminyldiphosphoundecaprenol N-acetyl-beta-D-mannosaminyltransferase